LRASLGVGLRHTGVTLWDARQGRRARGPIEVIVVVIGGAVTAQMKRTTSGWGV